MTNTMTRILAIIALVILSAIGARYWDGQRATVPPDPGQRPDLPAAPIPTLSSPALKPDAAIPARTTASTVTSTERTPGLPASLQGSTPDGGVTLDAGGNVVATPGLRRLFDYFLSTIGELEVAQIRTLLLDHVRRLHGALVADQVAAIFDRYVDYQRALSDAGPAMPGDLDARLAIAKQLRRRFFDAATADAFFGEEEAYADYTLERMRISRDASLDEVARLAQLKALEATLSPEQRASLQEANTAVIAEEQSRQFDAMKLDPAERQQERSALFGEEAAARLADLDRERAAWDQRVAAYVQARNAINANAAFNEAQRRQSIAQLRANSFDSNEARRIQSLESVGQL